MSKRVSERAVLKRVNRKLAHRYEKLSKRRSGEFHHIDFYRNVLLTWPVDLESFARDLGVLTEGEKISA